MGFMKWDGIDRTGSRHLVATSMAWRGQVIRTIHRDLKLENLFVSEDGAAALPRPVRGWP